MDHHHLLVGLVLLLPLLPLPTTPWTPSHHFLTMNAVPGFYNMEYQDKENVQDIQDDDNDGAVDDYQVCLVFNPDRDSTPTLTSWS